MLSARVPSSFLAESRKDSTEDEYHKDAEEEATQRVGPYDEAFKDDKNDENFN